MSNVFGAKIVNQMMEFKERDEFVELKKIEEKMEIKEKKRWFEVFDRFMRPTILKEKDRVILKVNCCMGANYYNFRTF